MIQKVVEYCTNALNVSVINWLVVSLPHLRFDRDIEEGTLILNLVNLWGN